MFHRREPGRRVSPLLYRVGTAAGELTLSAEAFDAAGSSSGVVTRALLVRDVVAPQVVITAPVAGASVDPRNPLLVSVTGTDQVGVTEIGFNAAGATSLTDTRAVTPAAAARTESFSVVFGTPPISGGTLTLGASSRDAAGNVGTAAPVVVSVLDVVAPDVAGVTPANGASGVDPATTIVVTFTEPMDRATLNGASVVLASGGTAVAGALAFSPDDRIATLTPIGQPLALNTTFTLTVGTGAPGIAPGNQLAAPRTFTFTTASPDTAGPRVLTIESGTQRGRRRPDGAGGGDVQRASRSSDRHHCVVPRHDRRRAGHRRNHVQQRERRRPLHADQSVADRVRRRDGTRVGDRAIDSATR